MDRGLVHLNGQKKNVKRKLVLILVLMEYGLGLPLLRPMYSTMNGVLILVLMEYGLGRGQGLLLSRGYRLVLILVLMEYGLGLYLTLIINFKKLRS